MTSEALVWYGTIFGWLFVTGIGLPPCPEEVGILYAAGVAAVHAEVKWVFAWLACGLGIMAADCVLYGIGRRWGRKLFKFRWVQRVINDEKRQRIEKRFDEHGMKMLIMARFLPPLRTGVFIISGAAKYSFTKFLIADAIYCTVGVGVLFLFGGVVIDLAHRYTPTAIMVAVIAALIYGLYRYFKYLKLREGGAIAPVSILESMEGEVPAGEPAIDPAGAKAAEEEAERALED